MKNNIKILFLLFLISIYYMNNARAQEYAIQNKDITDAMVINIKDRILQQGDIISSPSKEKCAITRPEPYIDPYHTSNDECVCKADIHYPELIYVDMNIAEKINEYLKKFAEEFGCHDEYSFGAYSLKYRVMGLRRPVLSVEFSYTEDTGGAHGMYGINTLNFNLKTGEKILLEDLIGVKNYKIVNKYLLYILKKDKRSFYNPEMQVDFVSDEVIKNFDIQSFYVTPTGVMLQFNPYEVGPYSSGIISVELLSEFINQDYFTKYVTR